MYDLSILKNFLNKDVYREYRSYVRDEDIGKELRPILSAMDSWYTVNTGSPALEDIANLTFANGIPDKEREFTKSVFNTLQSINGTESVKSLLERFKSVRTCQEISLAAYEASEGRREPAEVLLLAEKLRHPVEADEIEYVTDDLHTILRDTVQSKGLRWRLASLNRSLGSLRKGNFGFVFARPETGKTTFLASEVTHMSGQLSKDSGPILWFNNEEMGEVVKSRLYQAALGATLDHLKRAPDRAIEKYREVTHGKINVFDSASIHKGQVEAICAQENPSLILFDQIDKVKGFKADREDLAMGAIYQWARELAKTYCPVVGVCQADGTAEGEKWLHMGHVANAKTAKQAEADFILGIGKSHEQGLEFIRYINISKNKLSGDDDSDRINRHPKITVLIKPEIGRYEDI